MNWKGNFFGQNKECEAHSHYWTRKIHAKELDYRLRDRGFDRTRERAWVNSENAPFRKVIELTAMKGASDSLRWGYSFDFCPLVNNDVSKIIWARTPKSARPMLTFDPIDHCDEKGHGRRISAFFSNLENSKNFSVLFEESVRWFSRVVTLEQIIAEFDDWQNRKAIRFQYENYICAPLAHAFCLAKNQQSERAMERFMFWCQQNEPRPNVSAKLSELLRQTHVGTV